MLNWQSSPDLKHIEKLWSIISRRVYANGRQFDSVQALTESLINEWETISNEILMSQVDFMPRRCIDVIESKGNKTHY